MPPVLDWLRWIFLKSSQPSESCLRYFPILRMKMAALLFLNMAVGLLIWWKVGGEDRRQEDGLSGLAKAHRALTFLGL